jgi:hypothetical protein
MSRRRAGPSSPSSPAKGLLHHSNLLGRGPTPAPLNRRNDLNAIRRFDHRHGFCMPHLLSGRPCPVSSGTISPTKYWFSTLPANIPFRSSSRPPSRVARERDYYELKQEDRLGHLEGRLARLSPSRKTVYCGSVRFLVIKRFSSQDHRLERSR